MAATANDPCVSVVICAYNAGEYLRPSLDSIRNQTYENLEIILVDDGSTDGSTDFLATVEEPRLTVLRQSNEGKPVALNRALETLTGAFYAIHDADDISHSERIECQVRHLQQFSDHAAVYTGHDLLLNERHVAPRFRAKGPAECRADIDSFRMPAHDPTGMYRVSMVGDFRYDLDLRIGQGYDYVLRVGERFPTAVLGRCLYSYRVHKESLTKKDPGTRDRYIREAQRRACKRRNLIFEEVFTQYEGDDHQARINRFSDNNIASDFIESVVDLRADGRFREAIATGLTCVSLHPRDPAYYRALVYALMPAALRSRIRPSERMARRYSASSVRPE